MKEITNLKHMEVGGIAFEYGLDITGLSIESEFDGSTERYRIIPQSPGEDSSRLQGSVHSYPIGGLYTLSAMADEEIVGGSAEAQSSDASTASTPDDGSHTSGFTEEDDALTDLVSLPSDTCVSTMSSTSSIDSLLGGRTTPVNVIYDESRAEIERMVQECVPRDLKKYILPRHLLVMSEEDKGQKLQRLESSRLTMPEGEELRFPIRDSRLLLLSGGMTFAEMCTRSPLKTIRYALEQYRDINAFQGFVLATERGRLEVSDLLYPYAHTHPQCNRFLKDLFLIACKTNQCLILDWLMRLYVEPDEPLLRLFTQALTRRYHKIAVSIYFYDETISISKRMRTIKIKRFTHAICEDYCRYGENIFFEYILQTGRYSGEVVEYFKGECESIVDAFNAGEEVDQRQLCICNAMLRKILDAESS